MTRLVLLLCLLAFFAEGRDFCVTYNSRDKRVGDFSSAGGLPAAEIAKWEFPKPPPSGAELTGSATDDGLPMDAGLSFLWSKVSGPGTVTFANATNAITTARFSAVGTYVLRLTASDSDLAGSDELTVEVIANHAPVVSANSGGTVGAFESFPLAGAVSDDGLPASASVVYGWSVISTPVNAVVTFQNSAATNTSVRMDRTCYELFSHRTFARSAVVEVLEI